MSQPQVERESQRRAERRRRAYNFPKSHRDRPLDDVMRATGFGLGFLGAISSASSSAFSGDFSTLVPGLVLHYAQPDRNLTEGTTLLHTVGSGPVITLSGTRTGAPTPIWVTCPTVGGTLTNWKFNVYYDGLGTTPAMAGVTSASTVALTGAGAGLTLNIAAGTAVAAMDVWKATGAQVNELSGTGLHYTQAGAANQPIISAGLNGHPFLVYDGVNDSIANATFDLPATFFVWSVFRLLATPGSAGILLGGDVGGFFGDIRAASTGGIQQYSGNIVNSNSAATLNTFGRVEAFFNNASTDYVKFGATTVTGANAGAGDPAASRSVGATASGTNAVNCEVGPVLYLSAKPSAPQLAALSAAVTSYYGGGAAV